MLEALIFPISVGLIILTLVAWIISKRTKKKIYTTVALAVTLTVVVTISILSNTRTNREKNANIFLAASLAQRYEMTFKDVTPDDLPLLAGEGCLTQPLLIAELQHDKFDYENFYHILYSTRYGTLNASVLAETATIVFAERYVFETRAYMDSGGKRVEVSRIGAVLYCFDTKLGRFTGMLIVEPPPFTSEVTDTGLFRVSDRQIIQYALDHCITA